MNFTLLRQLSIIVIIALLACMIDATPPGSSGNNCNSPKWEFLNRKLMKEGMDLVKSSTSALDYLGENPSIMAAENAAENGIDVILESLVQLGINIHTAYDSAPQGLTQELLLCSYYSNIGPLYVGGEENVTRLLQYIRRRLLRGAMVGTIKESLPSGHMMDRQLKVDGFDRHLRKVLLDLIALARVMDMPQSIEIYEYWHTDESCDGIMNVGCEIIEILAARLDQNIQLPSICEVGACLTDP